MQRPAVPTVIPARRSEETAVRDYWTAEMIAPFAGDSAVFHPDGDANFSVLTDGPLPERTGLPE